MDKPNQNSIFWRKDSNPLLTPNPTQSQYKIKHKLSIIPNFKVLHNLSLGWHFVCLLETNFSSDMIIQKYHN